jgi:hypothetical protein
MPFELGQNGESLTYKLEISKSFGGLLCTAGDDRGFQTGRKPTKYGLRVSPFDAAFLRRVDLGSRRHLSKKKAFDVVEKKVLRVRVGQI